MIRFLTRKVRKIDKENWDSSRNEILMNALDDEVIMIYRDGEYYGHIDMHSPLNIMLPEWNPDFEPQELVFDDEVIEKAYGLFGKCKKLRMIPLNLLLPSSEVMIFICYKTPVEDISVYESALDTCVASERTKALFLEKLLKGKELLILSDLDEFTYKCYCMIQNSGIQIRVEGLLWPLVKIGNNGDGFVPEEKICHVTPEWISEIGAVINAEECMRVKSKLREKGIDAYTLLVPVENQIDEYSIMEDIMRKYPLSFYRIAKKRYKTKLENYFFRKFLKIEDEEEIISIADEEFIHPEMLGDEQATIFLIGPCIAGGSAGFESWSLASILRKKTVQNSLKYKIKRVGTTAYSMDVEQVTAELDITNEDIVFLFCSNLNPDYVTMEGSIDLRPIYNQRKTEELFFQDHPMHTLGTGNEAIADIMLPYILKKPKEELRHYMQIGVPRLTRMQRKELDAFIEDIRIPEIIKDKETVGAIVMNANPFTRGHCYLIEKAAECVTYLYVMVVREDLSEFEFQDRFRLVKKGTAHLKNVVVVSSGSFVLSRQTMSEYFQKEDLQGRRIDASKDVAFFGKYIASALSIGVRFVGEEPFDSVTRQYNEEMKEKLPVYGIKVVEIPRKNSEGNIISASIVRDLYQKEDWKGLEKFVPEDTLQFLKSKPLMRNKKLLAGSIKKKERYLHEWTKLFADNTKVVLYATGKNGEGIYDRLSEEEKEKVCFVDIKATKKKYQFCGKQVEEPEKLITDLNQVPIIITTTKYQLEACRYLLELGVEINRMHQNMTIYL